MTKPTNVTTFLVAGLDCPTEEQMIRRQLQAIPEIEKMDFNFIGEEVTIYHSLDSIESLKAQIETLGMRVSIKSSVSNSSAAKTGYDNSWLWITTAGMLALISEGMAYLYQTEQSLWVGVMALAAIVISGPTVFKKGLFALRSKTLNINSLMFIAITGAILIGEWPEAAMVTVLFALAERIERYSLDKARLAIRSLLQIAPDEATVKTAAGTWQKLPVEGIKPGTIIRVKPGERIPLDGIVISGQSSVNQAPITGESMPISKQVGDSVFAGTLNERGSLEVNVSKESGDTLLAKIGKAIEQAQAERAPTQRFVDQFAKYYTPIMVLIAVAVALIPPLLLGC